MEPVFAVVIAQHAYLRQNFGKNEMENDSEIVDEIFSGWAVRILSEDGNELYRARKLKMGCLGKNGWLRIETHYQYSGYVRCSELRRIDCEELKLRQNRKYFWHIKAAEADLLSLPKVQGIPKELLLKNSIVELLQTDVKKGWSLVRTAAGQEGYLHQAQLKVRKDNDGYFFGANFSLQYCEEQEGTLRNNLLASALAYLGTQYRWGGKSSQGIDCSGLLFMSYLENGILIFRDARIEAGYPMHKILKSELKPGDAIYFPGHAALYLGKGKYIHSTFSPASASSGVVINSLNPEDADYREDLALNIIAYGSIFVHRTE